LAACILPAAATGCGGQQALTVADVIRNDDHHPKEENPTHAPIFIDGYKPMLVQGGIECHDFTRMVFVVPACD
jgi:hypothetical protein